MADTLFGQLCWAIRNRWGEAKLQTLLKGYTAGQPFLVVSDAFPSGYIPRPALPAHFFRSVDSDRKEAKKKKWLPVDKVNEPVTDWLRHCVGSEELPEAHEIARSQPHNTINRQTETTGRGMFAPYAMEQYWYLKQRAARSNGTFWAETGSLDIYLISDSTRFSIAELKTALSDIGHVGFGRDASIGLGRFDVDAIEERNLPSQAGANAWLTLGPCAPQGTPLDPRRSFYQVFTRFGRHGDIEVLRRSPFKTPILMAAGGAVLSPLVFEARSFIGQGLGGDGSLSKSLPQTVHQGYTPVIGICLPSLE
ncbi:MAG TPA: CRISPR-associated protein Csm7 [Candidatus Eisenbacteria bacterium]|nr:CRISPR-associated protein Csm7 [Candidatus Eisenbacteria bacterium]